MVDCLQIDTASALSLEMDRLSRTEYGVTFWEATDVAVVMGLGGHEGQEVYAEAANSAGAKIIKRRSGGGTVVLGPGVLCFSLVIPGRRELCNPVGLAQEIMPLAAAALCGAGLACTVRGSGDLAIGEQKICGIAQKWTRRAILFHGSILVDFDLGLIETLLPHPPREPDYRGLRKHKDFCTTLNQGRYDKFSPRQLAAILLPDFTAYVDSQIEKARVDNV